MAFLSSCSPDALPPESGTEVVLGLEGQIRGRLDGLDANTALYAKHLPSGREVAIRADDPVNTLSIIEIPIMVLRRQLYSSRLPQRISFRAGIGHKTGDMPPVAGNDAGIIYSGNGPIVVSVFATQNRGDFFELEATLGLIAEDLLDDWGTP